MPFHYAFALDHPAADRWLSDAELRDYASLSVPEHRPDWRAGRIAAKRAVRAAAGIAELDRIELVPVASGAPVASLRDANGVHYILPLSLSLSHCRGRAAAVATLERCRVGVDLELESQVRAAHAGYYLTRAEREAGAATLTELWALKEAAWKALRCDASTPLTALELHFDPSGAMEAVSLRGGARVAEALLVRPWPGYVLAVVSVAGVER